MKTIEQSVVDQSLAYEDYYALIENLLSQSHYLSLRNVEAETHNTRLNLIKMERLDKAARMTAQTRMQMAAIRSSMIWLSITEAWSGDAAQILPTIQKMSMLSAKVTHRLILRDQHPEVMNAFLSGGSRSIPMVIILDATSLKVLGHWGPRPAELQSFVQENLHQLDLIKDQTEYTTKHHEFLTKTQRWYAKDKTYSTQKEFLEVLKKAML